MTPKYVELLISRLNFSEISEYLAHVPKKEYRDVEFIALAVYQNYALGDIIEAVDSLKKACKLNPNNYSAWNYLCDFYQKMNSINLAQEAINHSLAINPKNPLSLYKAANLASYQKDYKTAYKLALEAKQLLPENNFDLSQSLNQILNKSHPDWSLPLIGKTHSLVRISHNHKSFLSCTRQNDSFMHSYNFFVKNCESQLNTDIEIANRSPVDVKKIEWVVEKNGKPIGLVSLETINFLNKSAEFIIGFPKDKGGYAALEASLLVLEFGFRKMGLKKIISYVYGDNHFSQKNTIHLGFEQEGLLKSHVYDPQSDSRLDLYVNGLLEEQFKQNPYYNLMAKKLLGRSLIDNDIFII